jgi:serine/threonine-protein kinase
MAPEQATDAPIDARADLFSLGVLLFELFTGRHPWSGGSELEIFHVMANEPPEDILSLRPKLDKELAMVVDRLLEKDPARRFGSADEVRAHLDRWLDTHGYKDDNAEAVARFVRRNAMRQQRWFERAVAGEFVAESVRAKARLLGTRGRNGPLDLRSAPQAATFIKPSCASTTYSPRPR